MTVLEAEREGLKTQIAMLSGILLDSQVLFDVFRYTIDQSRENDDRNGRNEARNGVIEGNGRATGTVAIFR